MNYEYKLTPLSGHTSPETAYVVDDYPYGFTLRCKIRYWLEFKEKQGFRLVSQTTNPKIVGREVWNKPKASTYANIGQMGLDEKNHVQWDGIYYNFEDLDRFKAAYGAAFDETQNAVWTRYKTAYDLYQSRKQTAAAKAEQPA